MSTGTRKRSAGTQGEGELYEVRVKGSISALQKNWVERGL